MPLHDLGYRAWSGRLCSRLTRWCVIAETGIRRAWLSSWVRRLMSLAWLPAIWFAVAFLFYEQSVQYPTERRELASMLRGLPQFEEISAAIGNADGEATTEQLSESRHLIWSWLLQVYLRYPQASIMVLVIGMIAPPLISQDVRSRAFLLYFSHPLTRLEYILGKACTIWFYLFSISALPALTLYALGVALSPELNVVEHTWDLPLRIVAASFLLMAPTSTFALLLSSTTTESRYAGFMWFAIWILGWVAYSLLTAAETFRQGVEPEQITARWELFSPYHTLGRGQSWVFGLSTWEESRWALALLLAVTVCCTAALFRRVAAPLRA